LLDPKKKNIKLTSYVVEITKDFTCVFRRTRSNPEQIFCFRQVLEN